MTNSFLSYKIFKIFICIYREEEPLFSFPSGLTIFFIILYVVTSVVAVLGNILVIYVVIFKRLRTVTNMYLANLALADITIGMFAIPFQFQAIILQKWTLPQFLCKESIVEQIKKLEIRNRDAVFPSPRMLFELK